MHQNGIPSVKRFAESSQKHIDDACAVAGITYGSIDSVIDALHSESNRIFQQIRDLKRRASLNAIRLKIAKHEREYGNTVD